ncbi:leucine-rich repeat transmembrane neuronal protein 4-like [Arapaima gigas]
MGAIDEPDGTSRGPLRVVDKSPCRRGCRGGFSPLPFRGPEPTMRRTCGSIPQQVSVLTFYRHEQPIVDYCQAHQPPTLRVNMGFDGSRQGLGGLEELSATPAAAPATTTPTPRTPPSLRLPREGPCVTFPSVERSTLGLGR